MRPPLDIAPGLADPATLRALTDNAMRCGGCAAKVGPEILDRALANMDRIDSVEIPIGLAQRDDAAVVVPPAGKLMVHSVDGFRAFIADPYVFGQVAANHALNDLYAMGATPHTALAIATLPYGLADKTENDLTQMMAGAKTVLQTAGAALIGGHTNEGLELALSLAVNGLVDEDKILRKGGMMPGQALILTKGLGTGCLFAADMRHKAKGRWIEAALASMLQSGSEAADCFLANGATACTDVSGFGLAGHLLEMIEGSKNGATLDLAALPTLDGAREVIAQGILSSLQSQNERLDSGIEIEGAATNDPAYRLLFDPQTAGGLLASVPAKNAADCVSALKERGYARTAIIGEVTAGDARLRLRA